MLAAGKQNALLPHDDSNRAKKSIANSFPFLSSGLYRRPRIHTGSAAAVAAGRGLAALWPLTAGGELHPALKQTFYLPSITPILQNARGYGIMFLSAETR